MEDNFGKTAPGKQVIFPGDLNNQMRAPAHLPGTPKAASAPGEAAIARMLSPQDAVARQNRIEFKALQAGAKVPELGTILSAGYDLAAAEAVTLKPGERTTIPLGFAMALPDHLHGRIESRSGLALKGLVVLTGVIDADYRGEVKVIMQNFSDKAHEFAAGDRVAQLVLRTTVHVPFETVEELSETGRGSGGFGSTGK